MVADPGEDMTNVKRSFRRGPSFGRFAPSRPIRSITWWLWIASCAATRLLADKNEIPEEKMRAIFDEVRTPYKYGVVISPPVGRKVDCPSVFRQGNKWYMVYVQLEPEPAQGYTTQLAESTDLLHWKPMGTILDRGSPGTWDRANAGGGIALFDPEWGGSNELQTAGGRYWLSYIGGARFGYETTPLSIGLASTDESTLPRAWSKTAAPVLNPTDTGARSLESETLYKSYLFRDESRTLGAPFVMFYNAKPHNGSERIFSAISEDMKTWRRYGVAPALENPSLPGAGHPGISGDPQVVRMANLWVMFYFGAFWKPGAFDTFAASPDLVHWTKWKGPDLVAPSVAWDREYAHKPWVIKYDGVVYHFYCAVGDQGRTIALATSRDLRTQTP